MRTAIFLVLALSSANFALADLADRWTQTATDGAGIARGDAMTLTWGFVADGTSISGGVGEATSDSNLVDFLDGLHGDGGGGADLRSRPWYDSFESVFDRWSSVSGLSFQYETNDSGQQINGFTDPRGQLGVVADLRIGGHSIDGQFGPNTLAYNYFPEHGDMVIDTDNSTFFGGTANNLRGLRNVVAHEVGHGLGLDHRESTNSNFLMEPSINTSFDGPQFDDIWSAQRGYGDAFEKGLGNDLLANATDIGSMAIGGQVQIGADAGDQQVALTDTDFISIDGTSDTDFLTFTLSEAGLLDLLLDPMGPTYQKGPQNGSQSAFDASSLSDLMFQLFAGDGTTLLGTGASNGIGFGESLLGLDLAAGQYFVQVSGADDVNQMYRLTGTLSAVPEPSSFVVFFSAAAVFLRRRRPE